MDDKIWMLLIGIGGFSLSQLFYILKDRTRKQEDTLTTTNLLIMEHKTKLAIIEKDLEIITKIKKDLDAAHDRIRELNKEHIDLYEEHEKFKKELNEIYLAHVEK